MIKNHIKSIYILLILVSFTNFSCTEEFLEINANQITVDAISKEYEKIDPELFQEAAEQYILMLNELEVGEASFDYLTGFCCYKINFVNPKTKRNLTGLFSKELKGTASPEYNINNAKKAFKAYIFAMRSGQMELAPPGWTIEKDIEIELLKDVAAQDVGIESLFNQ